MWGAPEEPPDDTEVAGSTESVSLPLTVSEPPGNVREICEDNKSQLETFKDIMLRNKNDLKRKEEELQEYASKLSEIKSRAKLSRRSKDAGSSSVETTPKSRGDGGFPEMEEDTVDDISQARTPKAKSSLLQRKLAENRKIFEKRSKEMTENKRAVEEKVEAIRQQMDQTDLTIVESQKDPLIVTAVRPVLITQQIISPDMQIGLFQDKDNKIAELSNRILELEAMVIDLQDNLKEKDSVIDSKTKAVMLMSADLSKKGKSTLDTLEDTKDEMRTMQENFVLIETSLRGKNVNLLEQLQERNDKVTELEATINRFEQEMEEKRLAETASATLSRTTIDTLADTKDEMRSMQENFVLIETSLKEKIENLLQQLEQRETKLAETKEKIYKYETGAGIVAAPEIPDLQYKIDRLEQSNRGLQDEKYELQKSIAELQEKIVTRESSNGNGLIVEKDNRIAELENLIEELKSSNQLLEEESKAELQKQVDELATKNEEFRCKIDDLERLNMDLEIEKNELRAKLPDESGITREDAMVKKLTKELDDLNKSMIKLKAQHKGKLRNLQKQLESFKMVSDVNAELVKLGNQVALLEEEKGNLQLSLVDFDELKALGGDWQDRIADLESRVSTQSNDIQAHIEAIAILENQKLDLTQELHTVKQEISSLEAENAESENLRVTAEMKIVDMEEQMESLNKLQNENVTSVPIVETERLELLSRIENLMHENSELVQRVAKLEEKATSEAGSTESFETIHEDRNELTKKLEALSARNAELEEKLSKLEEASRSNVGSTESFETINDTDRSELMKKIDILSRENSDLMTKLNKFEEKGSSDTGSTESFEKIPEHIEGSTRIEMLTRENNELVIKLTKLEEKFDYLTARQVEETSVPQSEEISENNEKLENLVRENNDLVIELTRVQEKLSRVNEDKDSMEKLIEDAKMQNETAEDLKKRLELATMENNELIIKLVKFEEKNARLSENLEKLGETEDNCQKNRDDENTARNAAIVTVASLESEIEQCRRLIKEQSEIIDEMKTKLADKETELETRMKKIEEYEASGISVENLQSELKESFGTIDEWKFKCTEMERKMDILESGKNSIEEGLRILQDENKILMEDNKEKEVLVSDLKRELDETIVTFASRFDEERVLAVKQEEEMARLEELLRGKDQELHEKYSLLQNEMIKIDSLQEELNIRRAQLRENETTIIGLNEEIKKLTDDISSNREELTTKRSEIAILHEELQTRAAEEARNEEFIAGIKHELNEQLRVNTNLEILMDSASTEVEHLRALLIEKEDKLASLASTKNDLEDKIGESTIAKAMIESQLESQQNNLDESLRYAEGLKVELSDAYKMLELLKVKHTEDIEMQNTRLENLIEDFNEKTHECEILRGELAEGTERLKELETRTMEHEILRGELVNKTRLVESLETRISELEVCREQLNEKELLVDENFTKQMKIALESRITELERKLAESEANTQTQLQKRKILAANLKKKSAQFEKLEAKAAGFEAKVEILEARAAELEIEAADFRARASEFEARVAELEPKSAKLEVKVAELAVKADKFEAKATDLEIKASEFESKSSNYEARLTELEPKAADLEEKWLTEKSEKEASNVRIREFELTIQDNNDTIINLENKLSNAQSEAAEFTNRAEKLTSELHNSTEKIDGLVAEVMLMSQEIESLRVEIEERTLDLQKERMEKENLLVDYENCKKNVIDDETHRQQVLDEAKEKARELGVRMQVMESEYVEQLSTIQTLRTENGMLLSKQAQINERLENAEKEASERKILLDQLQRETSRRETENLRQSEAATSSIADERSRLDEKIGQSCDQCDQCQTVVQALEAKLQERDAEIENLDNELANSIGNFVHMRESLRVSDLMNQSSSRARINEESRDDIAFQYNALSASNAEMREKLNSTIRENEELKEKIVSLQALNVALEERTGAAEDELIEGREATTRLHEVDAIRAQLMENFQARENELAEARNELEIMKQRHEELMTSMRSQIVQLETHNNELKRNCDDLSRERNDAEREIVALRDEIDRSQTRTLELEMEIEKYREENLRLEEMERTRETRVATSLFTEVKDDGPQLFDAAKVFGLPATSDSSGQRELADLTNVLANKEMENARFVDEIKRLSEHIVSLESHGNEINARNAQELKNSRENCQRLEIELTKIQEILIERNRQIESLNSELNNVGVQLAEQFNQQGNNEMMETTIETLRLENEENVNKLRDKEIRIESLTVESNELAGKLENLQRENNQWIQTIDLILSVVSDDGDDKIEDLTILEKNLPAIHSRLVEITKSLKESRNERQELLDSLEISKKRITQLEGEFKASDDSTRIQELEERVDRVIRERDIKQLQVNDLARSLEEMQESMENSSSNEEIRLRNLQASLDQALSENDRLKNHLDTLARDHEVAEAAQSEKLKVCKTMEQEQSEKLKSCEIIESDVAQSSENRAETNPESGWDDETRLDEEILWNPEDAQLAEGENLLTTSTNLLPSLERRLNARIAELEDTIRDLEAEREKLTEEIKMSQLRNGKLVKKLKEFKIQNESLQQQLKIQKATGTFCDLDSAIEEELKLQIVQLEKAQNEAKDETKKTSLERDNLSKRIDVLMAANERLVEMKERQDMDMEVLKIRTNELTNKLQSMEWQFRDTCGDETPSVEQQMEIKRIESVQGETAAVPIKLECLCKKYKEEIDELRDEMEALAAENEQLQKLLEDLRTTRLSTESRLNDELTKRTSEIEKLSERNSEMQKELDETRNNYQSLMNQRDLSVQNSEDEIAHMRQNENIMKIEITEKTMSFEADMENLRGELNLANLQINKLKENLQAIMIEKEELIERTIRHEETTEKLANLSESMTELTDLLNSRVQEVAELKREIQKLKTDKNEALDTVEGLAQNHNLALSMKNEEIERYVKDCESRLNVQSEEISSLGEKLSAANLSIETSLVNVENLRDENERLNNALAESRSHRESLQSELASKEQELFKDEDEVRKYALEIERLNDVLGHLQKSSADVIDETKRRIREIEEREESLKRTINELTTRESDALGQMYREICEKDGQISSLQQTVVSLEEKFHEIAIDRSREKIAETPEIVEDSPSLIATSDEIRELKSNVEQLREELSRKNEQIEDYRYQLSENTYPAIIQALQDQVNLMYEEKAKIEASLEEALRELADERELRERSTESSRYQSRTLKSTEMEEFRNEDEVKIRDAKDEEIYDLRNEIDQRAARFRDLHDRYESVEVEMNELRLHLATKEEEIVMLQRRLESMSKECELLRQALKRELPRKEIEELASRETLSSSSSEMTKEQNSNELDLALYMLHQRDVKCDELTHELMQLLEERDTLQLRLSNAIRINEELRRSLPNEAQLSEPLLSDVSEPMVEKPSPSRSVGPVEIAKEAIDSPNDEKIALAHKLSQLHNMGHRRDVRLMDDRDMRHNQQMSLLAHRDVLNTLPPEAAARLVNANYTLSRDVQSQSSILMNWLWGKSTPKVVHM